MDNIRDAHYFTIPSQGNINTLCELHTFPGSNKILAASLRRKIYLFDYFLNNDGYLKPSVKEIHFTYIPSGAEIISMDAFNKSETSNDFIIGITIIKQQCETYFNIYSENEPSMEFNIDQIAQNCFMLDLEFVPNHLYHTKLYTDLASQTSEVVWLLSGGDKKMHMYGEDKPNHCYREVEIETAFPELNNVSAVVMWTDIKYCQNNTRRVTAYGCQCGLARFFLVSVDPLEILKTWSFQSECIISSVRFFSLNPPTIPDPMITNLEIDIDTNKNEEIKELEIKEEEKIHLLVTNTVEESVVYMDVLSQGLKQEITLVGSNNYDAILCSLIADLDMDGQNEIILGSYGQELIMYKYENQKWNLKNQRKFANPIHALRYVDVTGDGVRELIALTLKGVHIMQHDLDYVQEIFMKRFKNTCIELNTEKLDSP